MRFFVWLLCGLLFYLLYGYRHSRLRHPVGVPIPALGPDFNPEQQLPESDLEE
jgi:hypothetical protein